MPALHHAILLHFDPATEALVRRAWETVREVTGSTFLFDSGERPHVTLAVYADADPASLEATLRTFRASPLDVVLASAASFSGEEGVVFLAPVVDTDLLDLHRRWHAEVPGSHAWYVPGAWVPHATVGFHVPAVGPALDAARRHLPIRGRYAEIALLEFVPGQWPVRYLASAPLSGGAGRR